MADTRIQLEVEDWIRKNWMPTRFGMSFRRERLPLRSGGFFDFDAVSSDDSIVASISTSGSKTSRGKHASGKLLKLRSDMLFLTLVEANHRLLILSERDMFELCEKEAAGGRVPPEIKFECAEIPDLLRERLVSARAKASSEVTVPQAQVGLGTQIASRFAGIGLDEPIPEQRGQPVRFATFDDDE